MGNAHDSQGRTKLAILGGGPASLSAAYYLTTLEPDRYDITIYEMSWRLGGKTASGRGEDGRIEEHGLHVLFGGYHNTFDLMIGCYEAARAECGPDAVPFEGFLDAVEPHQFGVIGDDRFHPWRKWDLQFPINGGVPGDPPLPTTWDVTISLVQILIHVIFGARTLRWLQNRTARPVNLRARRRALVRNRRRPPPSGEENGGDWFLRRVLLPSCRAAFNRESRVGRVLQSGGRSLQRLLHKSERAAVRLRSNRFPPRIWTALDLVLATCRGICRDRVLFRPDGFERLDRVELRAWLRYHGARKHTLHSPFARVIYEATFQGFFTERMAAGAALRILLWMALTYKGAMYYKVKGATGDIINVPLYRLLERRGVKFAFFHRVKGLCPGRDEHGDPVIDSIDLECLARPRPGEKYDPLIRVGPLSCWPSAPIFDRILPEDGEDAARSEEFFGRARVARPIRLSRRGASARARASDVAGIEGDSFDKVIFGLPVACIPYVCRDLVEEGRSRWADQHKLETIKTVALQLWCKYPLDELGWKEPPPLLSLFWDPLNTWCDMSHVLQYEGWSTARRPRAVAYFCGPLARESTGSEGARIDPAFDARWRERHEREAKDAREQLLRRLSELWPSAGAPAEAPEEPRPVNWNILYDSTNRKGEARLDAQYLRANYDPHARCTVAVPRQTKLRIHADDTGYKNLTVAGDWTANHILVACLEGTVQSGIRAARAISGKRWLYPIIGEGLLNPGRATTAPSDGDDDAQRPPTESGTRRRIDPPAVALGREARG